MKLAHDLDHIDPTRPDSSLMLYQLALDLAQISEVYIPLSENFWRSPEENAVPEKQAPGSTDWGLHDMRVMFTCASRKFCNDSVRREVGDELADNVHYLMSESRARLRVKTFDILEAKNLTELYETWSDVLWEKLVQRIRNPGLAIFLQESGGLLPRSTHIPAMILMGLSSSSLEFAYGYGFDIAGNYGYIKSSDPMSLWVPTDETRLGEPAFKYELARSRAIFDEFKDARTIMSIGAGWLPEVRHAEMFYGNEKPNWTHKRLLAFGTDPADVYPSDSSWITREHLKVHYERDSLDGVLRRISPAMGWSFDLVYAKDVFSVHTELLEPFMAKVVPTLNHGGKFMFDLVLDHPAARKMILLFGDGDALLQGRIDLFSREQALGFVESAIHAVSERLNEPLNWRCEMDQKDNPIGLMFTIYRT